jgi:hypothetical protein
MNVRFSCAVETAAMAAWPFVASPAGRAVDPQAGTAGTVVPSCFEPTRNGARCSISCSVANTGPNAVNRGRVEIGVADREPMCFWTCL